MATEANSATQTAAGRLRAYAAVARAAAGKAVPAHVRHYRVTKQRRVKMLSLAPVLRAMRAAQAPQPSVASPRWAAPEFARAAWGAVAGSFARDGGALSKQVVPGEALGLARQNAVSAMAARRRIFAKAARSVPGAEADGWQPATVRQRALPPSFAPRPGLVAMGGVLGPRAVLRGASWAEAQGAAPEHPAHVMSAQSLAPRRPGDAPEAPAMPGRAQATPLPGQQAAMERMLEDYFFRASRLPPASGAAFDPRLTPAWAGVKLPG